MTRASVGLLLAVLACEASGTKKVVADSTAPTAAWDVSRRVSPVDSAVTLALFLPSMNVPGGGSDRSLLNLGCETDHSLSLFVNVSRRPSEGYSQVKYRLDGHAPVSEKWLSVPSVGAIGPLDRLGFLKRLVGAQKLTFETSLGEVAIFDLRGLPEHLDEIRSDCKLPKLGRKK